MTGLAALLCCLTTTSQAVLVAGFTGTSLWVSGNSGDTVEVDYSVDLTGLVYTYNYQLRPITAPLVELLQINAPAAVRTGLGTTTADIFVTGTPPVGGAVPLPTLANISWFFPGGITPGFESIVVGFTSAFGPTFGTGLATDGGNGPWGPGGLVPLPVPEPTTVLAGALLLLPFGASTIRFLRKSRTA